MKQDTEVGGNEQRKEKWLKTGAVVQFDGRVSPVTLNQNLVGL